MNGRIVALVIGGALLIGIGLLTGCGSGTEPTATPTHQPTIRTILDSPDATTPLRPDQGALHVINPAGSGLQTLFEGSGGLSFAASPDGDQVAVMTQGRAESVLYVVDAATAARQEIARRPAMSLGEWSPDGDSLVLSTRVEGERLAVGVFSITTGEIQTYVLPESGYANPAFIRFIGWTPDSSAVLLAHPGPDRTSILRLNLSGGELMEVAVVPEFFPPIALSPDGERLAVGVLDYDKGAPASYSIQLLGSEGGPRSDLINFPDEVPLGGGHGLAWSPDGSQLAYGRLADSGMAMSQAFVLDGEGASVQVTSGEDGINGMLLWSPKQDALLVIRDICTSCDGFGKKVILAPADGSGEVRLPGAESYGHADAAWAPDGERFAYSGDALYVAKSDGSDSIAIVEIEGASYGPIVWPNDDNIFFIRTSTVAPVTYLAEPDGSDIEQFSVGANLPVTGQAHGDWPWPQDGRLHELVWTNDGSRAVLLLGFDREFQLVLQSADGHHFLVSYPFIENPTWSPDGREIAYEADGALWVIDTDTGVPRRVLDGVENTGIAWTPDSEEIIATFGQQVVSVPVDGNSPQVELFLVSEIQYDAPQLTVSPDGDAIAIGSDAGLSIGIVSTGQLVKVSEHSVRGLAWSPDGETLALGLVDTRGTGAPPGVYLASRDGQELQQLTEPSGRIHEVQYWLPDGRIMFLSHTQFI